MSAYNCVWHYYLRVRKYITAQLHQDSSTTSQTENKCVIIHLVKTGLRRTNWTLFCQGLNKYRTLSELDDVDLFWLKVTNHVMNSAVSYKNKLGYKTPFKPIIHSQRCQLLDDNISQSYHPSIFVQAYKRVLGGLIAVVGFQTLAHTYTDTPTKNGSYPCFG